MNSGHYMAYVRASNGVWNLMAAAGIAGAARAKCGARERTCSSM